MRPRSGPAQGHDGQGDLNGEFRAGCRQQRTTPCRLLRGPLLGGMAAAQANGKLPAADTTQRRPLAAALDGAQSAVPQATLSLSFGLTGMAADPSVALKSAREIRCLVSHSAIAES